MRKKNFTLLEIMIVICLLTLAASAIGWKMHDLIAKKRFRSLVERLHCRLHSCRQLSLNMQSDWEGMLKKQENGWVFHSRCLDDSKAFPLPSLKLGTFDIFLDGKPLQDSVCFYFTASGDVSPQGRFQMQTKIKDRIEWNLSDLFALDRGSRSGPAHPESLGE